MNQMPALKRSNFWIRCGFITAAIGLGAAMGLGYLTKALLFPMALIFWGIGLFTR